MLGSLVIIILTIKGCMTTSTGKCACASLDTSLFSDPMDRTRLQPFEAPNCLPLMNQTGDAQNGTFVKVSYANTPAWLPATDVYLGNCNESFGCVCNAQDETVLVDHAEDSRPLETLTSGQCSPIEGRVQICYGKIWIPVVMGNETGWLQKGNITFHPSCISGSGCPRIISREEWGARAAKRGVSKMQRTPRYAIIHHGATDGCRSRQECVRKIRSYQNYHMDHLHFTDIGYNFMVGEDGNVYEGRGWDSVGAHTKGCNSLSLGFGVIGDFTSTEPNIKALTALRSLIACGVKLGKLAPDYKLIGRRDHTRYPSQSPGQQMYNIIQTWDHYNRADICI